MGNLLMVVLWPLITIVCARLFIVPAMGWDTGAFWSVAVPLYAACLLAGVMGFTVRETCALRRVVAAPEPPIQHLRKVRLLRWEIAAALLIGIVLTWYAVRRTRADAAASEPAVTADCAGLKHTVMLPTLDTPIPNGTNAVWCAAFEVAWKKGAAIVPLPETITTRSAAVRLARSPDYEPVLPEGGYYAVAGQFEKGIAGQIRRDMAQRFPTVQVPALGEDGGFAVAYAYLAAQVRFPLPYIDIPWPGSFADSAGRKTRVRVFGLSAAETTRYPELRTQAQVLYADGDGWGVEEYVVDLCRNSTPSQIILARTPRKSTLAEAWKHVAGLIKKGVATAKEADLAEGDTLQVPVMSWEVTHRFHELEDGSAVLRAQQTVRFILNNRGAELGARSTVKYGCIPRLLHFDRPFLLVMKKRSATLPFFVMWVDNAELLTPQAER